MLTLVTGGAASGKSEYAERLAAACDGPRVYIATMRPLDKESVARIEKHRAARADRRFSTIERYHDLKGLRLPCGTNAPEYSLGYRRSLPPHPQEAQGFRAVWRCCPTAFWQATLPLRTAAGSLPEAVRASKHWPPFMISARRLQKARSSRWIPRQIEMRKSGINGRTCMDTIPLKVTIWLLRCKRVASICTVPVMK